ncbi:hypothetical protein [Methanolacinia petrolearia]|uniref:hypothetical protein n=1 Tax=Methanolacinia petrolearia TaxID=54120 RepID=UPI001650DB28|nr:hypothetical protein [Methanolacinia petrolearia]
MQTRRHPGKYDLYGGKGRAVFVSKEPGPTICERCFARLLREDLKGGEVKNII